jgi:(p)ppGpp synthase/HD superfamily hydrolase
MLFNVSASLSIEKYQKALRFAAEAHEEQSIPGTNLSYLLHITAVSFEVMQAVNIREDVDRDLAVLCALLHDVIEDTLHTFNDISGQFGKQVAEGVQALTKNDTIEKSERMEDSLNRIKQQPKEIWMVKMADRIVNLNPPPDFWNSEKIRSYYNEAKQIYESLNAADSYLADRLVLKIKEYKKYLK